MNLDELKLLATQKMGRGSLYLKKYSPEILLGVGLVGMVSAAVMAARATRNLDQILEDRKGTLDVINTLTTDDATEQEIVKAKVMVEVQTGLRLTKLYGPAVAIGSLSIVAILGSHGIMANRQVALVGAYNLLAQGYKTYRQRVVDQYGEEIDNNLYSGQTEETETEKSVDADGKTVKTKKKVRVQTGDHLSIYARCYDESNPNYRGDRLMDRAFLMGQQRYANDKLRIYGHVFLNDVYKDLGFTETKEGQLVGWVLKGDQKVMDEEGRDGFISFNLINPANGADKEFMAGKNSSVWLDFNVDGFVLDQI